VASPSGNASINVGVEPLVASYDPVNGYVYVLNFGGSNVSVIDGEREIASVNVGSKPEWATCDGRDGFLYVSSQGGDDVTVINGTAIVGGVTEGGTPGSSAYDSENGYIYLPDGGSNNISILNGTQTVGTVEAGLGADPTWATYDPKNGYVYVADARGTYPYGNVTVIDGTRYVASISVGDGPVGATYDDQDGYIYELNGVGDSISVINGTSIAATVGVGFSPSYAVYDSADGYVYVANSGSSNVSVMNGTRVVGTIRTGDDPSFVSYDDGDRSIYVSVPGSSGLGNTVTVVSGRVAIGTVTVGAGPALAAYDNLTGIVYIPNYNSHNVSLIQTWFLANFTESGLPSGTEWWVNTSGGVTTSGTNSTVSFEVPDGTFSYTLSTIDKSYASPGGHFSVNGRPVSETVLFSIVTYPITFAESGLPPDTNWSVTLDAMLHSSSGSTVVIEVPNGTYAYAVTLLTGWTTPKYRGSLTVNGSGIYTSVPWTQVMYEVTFLETGLAQTEWWVNVTGRVPALTNATTLSLVLPNGSYIYSISSTNKTYEAPGGVFGVNGAPVFERVAFSLVTYTVTFDEEGLSAGSAWSMVLGGVVHASTGTIVSFAEPNGTYLFSTGHLSGLRASPSSGTIVVSGANTTKAILFSAPAGETYTVSFAEAGLPSGTVWSVTFDDLAKNGTGDLAFSGIANGTYSFAIPPVTGYVAMPASGLVAVSGPPPAVSIAFKAAAAGNGNGSSTFLGLPSAEGYGVLGGVFIAVLVVTLVVVLLRKRGGKPPAGTPKPGADDSPASR
jgi:YVTN family beta-propeller protein